MTASTGSLGIEAVLPEVRVLEPKRHLDERGHFCETYNQRCLAALGIDCSFVQDNESLSHRQGTVRGLHFQSGSFAQAKLVRVARGAVFDVVVDLRRGSPRFGQFQSFHISDENESQVFIPIGFGHGFCTLAPATLVQYKVSSCYSSKHDTGVRWDDPDLAIPWPLKGNAPILSAKDQGLPNLRDHPALFTYEGS